MCSLEIQYYTMEKKMLFCVIKKQNEILTNEKIRHDNTTII